MNPLNFDNWIGFTDVETHLPQIRGQWPLRTVDRAKIFSRINLQPFCRGWQPRVNAGIAKLQDRECARNRFRCAVDALLCRSVIYWGSVEACKPSAARVDEEGRDLSLSTDKRREMDCFLHICSGLSFVHQTNSELFVFSGSDLVATDCRCVDIDGCGAGRR